MSTLNQSSNDKLYVRRALEASIHIGLVALVIFWCFKIGRPFLEIIVWGIIGLLVGAIVFTAGYKLFLRWLEEDTEPEPEPEPSISE